MEAEKNPAAVALGALGGKARALKLSERQKKAIARKGGKARQRLRREDEKREKVSA